MLAERARELERQDFALELEAIALELGASGFDLSDAGRIEIWPRWGFVCGADAERMVANGQPGDLDPEAVRSARRRAQEALESLGASSERDERSVAVANDGAGPRMFPDRCGGFAAGSAMEMARRFGWDQTAANLEAAKIREAAGPGVRKRRAAGI